MAPTPLQSAVGVDAGAAPGAATRLAPKPWRADYVHLRALRVQLRREISSRWTVGDAPAVLDVGCGERPYEPLFADFESRYVGLDTRAGPNVDVVGTGDDLPFDEAEFDCVLCTQALQYIQDPQRAVREMYRVLRPGGIALISTHGIGFVDRSGPDMWRWTHGLRRLADLAAPWSRLEVYWAAGVLSAAAYLAGQPGRIRSSPNRSTTGKFTRVSSAQCRGLQRRPADAKRFPGRLPDASVNYLLSSTK